VCQLHMGVLIQVETHRVRAILSNSAANQGLFGVSASLFCVSVTYGSVDSCLNSSSSRDLIQQRSQSGSLLRISRSLFVYQLYMRVFFHD